MAYGISAAIADAILDALFSGVTWTPPLACYVQLHTGDPGANGTANVSSYTTRTVVSWNSASGGSKSISAALVIEASWSGTNNEQIQGLSFWDSATSGTFLISTPLIAAVTIASGAAVNLPVLTAPWQGGIAA